jgi:hypothetical protein
MGMNHRKMSELNDMKDYGFDLFGPDLRKRDIGIFHEIEPPIMKNGEE